MVSSVCTVLSSKCDCGESLNFNEVHTYVRTYICTAELCSKAVQTVITVRYSSCLGRVL